MYLTVFFMSFWFCFINCDKCTLFNNGPDQENKKELLQKVNLLSSTKFVTEYDGYTYALKLCDDVSKDHPNASVTQSSKGPNNVKSTTTVLGRYNNTDIVGTDDWILLTFADGDKMVSKSCNGSNWKAMILLMCGKNVQENDNLHLIEGESNACMAILELKISLLCPEESWSGLTVFFTLFFIGFWLYFVVGVTYRRFVLGAKGFEQIPHYTLWASILAFPREMLRKLLRGDGPYHENMGVNQSRSGQQTGPDASDEPLLSP